ncbi:MAG: peptide chain release factor N(5)-glutamine methyltransferase [Gemmatimonadetes bacterium]|nr:peptide chain release factor N(5)-glutamine methyltransferase [Gemmatimonadota bacterium]
MAPRARKERTIGDELQSATIALRTAAVPHPEILALSTWASLERVTPGAVWLRRDDTPDAEFQARYRRAIERQVAGEPFQYAVGLVGFRHLDLYVDHRVLIPRSDSEGLVDLVLAYARRRSAGRWGVVADIGTGSGALALALAAEGRFERVIAIDVSAAALEVARINLASVSPPTPVELRQGALLEPLATLRVDVIVANLPYVTSGEWTGLLPLVRDWEPRVAFDGGPDGLTLYRELLGEAAAHLNPGGLIALEIDSSRRDDVLAVVREHGWPEGRVFPDATGRDRYILIATDDADSHR